MSSKHDAIEEIAEVLDTLNEIISKYELEDDFAYVFCCAVPSRALMFLKQNIQQGTLGAPWGEQSVMLSLLY